MKKGIFTTLAFSITISFSALLSFPALAHGVSGSHLGVQSQNNGDSSHQTQAFVDSQMYKTMLSINKSLNTLVYLTKGGQPPRKDLPLGQTVAGADGYQKPADNPPKYNYKKLKETVNGSKDKELSHVLYRETQVKWDGSASQLLNDISHQIGFHFTNDVPHKKDLSVSLNGDNLSIMDILNIVSKQLDGQANIYVSVPHRTIRLTPQ